MQLIGKSIIGFNRGEHHGENLRGINPATGETLEPDYYSASGDEIETAVRLAAEAFIPYSRVPGRARAAFLRKIAANIEAIGEPLVARATAETALPAARIQGETARTCGQLRMFADLIEEGSWVDARIETGCAFDAQTARPGRRLWRQQFPAGVFDRRW